MATIREIAAASGVSPAAVSRILNNDPTLSVSEETRKRVILVADEMGYVKKIQNDRACFRMGILQWFSAEQEISDDYYLQIRKGIEDFCVKNMISIIRAYRTDGNYEEILTDIDGLICVGKYSEEDIIKLTDKYPNTVFIDMAVNNSKVTSINVDMKAAAKNALRYLTGLGHKSIAFLGGIEYASGTDIINDFRKKGYIEYMEANNLPYDGLISEGEFNTPSGYESMNRLLDSKKKFTAVLAASDAIAIGAMKAIKDRGLRIPEDISIIGINDTEMSAYTTPALTTMHAPAYDIGQHGANLAFVSRNLNINAPLMATVSCTLIERESCKRIKG